MWSGKGQTNCEQNQGQIFKEALTGTLRKTSEFNSRKKCYQRKTKSSLTSGKRLAKGPPGVSSESAALDGLRPLRASRAGGPGEPAAVCVAPSGEGRPAASQRALQRVVVVLKALQFQEVLGAFTLLTGGQVCYLDGGRGDLRRLGEVFGCGLVLSLRAPTACFDPEEQERAGHGQSEH